MLLRIVNLQELLDMDNLFTSTKTPEAAPTLSKNLNQRWDDLGAICLDDMCI